MNLSNMKNLVFEGGGVLGIAYAGALKVLEEQGVLKQIEKVAGTSAGAITATLVSLGYTADEITDIVYNTNFKTFEDGWNPLRIASKFGLYKGNTFLKWMKSLIKQKGLPETATFADFARNNCRDLRVFATDLNTKSCVEFSADQTPNVVVAEAVRASMSIPLFFEAWKFSNHNPNDHIYVDGGTVYNFPITTFDKDDGSENVTLGLHLDTLSPGSESTDDLSYYHLGHYIKNLFDALLKTQEIDFLSSPVDKERSILIDDLGISATKFDLTTQEKDNLFNSGKVAATHALEDTTPATTPNLTLV